MAERNVSISATLVLAVLAFSSQAEAQDNDALSAELALTSDYIYRGQTFSDGNAAVQASATWRPAMNDLAGLHVDGWMSNIDFGDDDPADAEVSATLGYEFPVHTLTLDTGVTYISYVGAPRGGRYDYIEIHGAATAPLATGEVTAAVHVTPSYSGDAGPAVFSDVGVSFPFGQNFGADAAIGHAHLDPRAGPDYLYWQLGLSADVRGFTFGLAYHGHNQDGCTIRCAGRVALTVARAF